MKCEHHNKTYYSDTNLWKCQDCGGHWEGGTESKCKHINLCFDSDLEIWECRNCGKVMT